MSWRSAVKNDWIHWANMQKISNIVYFNLSGYRFRMLHQKSGRNFLDIKYGKVGWGRYVQSCEGFWGCFFLGGSCWAIAQTGSSTQISKADSDHLQSLNQTAMITEWATVPFNQPESTFFRGAFQILQATNGAPNLHGPGRQIGKLTIIQRRP